MRTSLSLMPRSIRLLYHTITSNILVHTKPHISEYSRFSLNLRCMIILKVEARASVHGIPLSEKTKGLKLCLLSRQKWRYLSLFSFSDFTSVFLGIVRRSEFVPKLKILASKIVFVPCFQNPCALTSSCVSSGTSP